MATDSAQPRSRRALLTGAAAGVAVLAAEQLARPLAAQAADGDPVLLGQYQNSSTETSITGGGLRVEGGVLGFAVIAHGVNDGPGLLASSDHEPVVTPESTRGSGDAIRGESGSGTGMYGSSESGEGVHGESESGSGVVGNSATAFGVVGSSGADIGTFGGGVFGGSEAGIGVWGNTSAANGRGVFGYGSPDGYGVFGQSDNGVGVHAEAGADLQGVALEVSGRMVFTGTGRTSIPLGSQRVSVDPSPVPVSTTATQILVTLLGNPTAPGKKAVAVHLSHVEITGPNAFDIVLTGPAARAIEASFFIVEMPTG